MGTVNQCLHYSSAWVSITFPKGEEKCALCPLLQTYSRNQCMATGELIADTRGRGWRCPLIFDNPDETEDTHDGKET